MKLTTPLATGFFALLLTGKIFSHSAQAEPVRGWLNWRGPQQNGTSLETGLPDTVDPQHPLWVADFPGQSTSVIANGHLYIVGYLGEGEDLQEGLICYDAETGKELWRTSTIALPGDPNNKTWANLPPTLRAGGDSWIAGSYDPVLKLYYLGTAQAKPWVAASRKMSPLDAALYTDSTLALDPKTGKMVWYYQHVGGETLDMDTVFERVTATPDGAKVTTVGGPRPLRYVGGEAHPAGRYALATADGTRAWLLDFGDP